MPKSTLRFSKNDPAYQPKMNMTFQPIIHVAPERAEVLTGPEHRRQIERASYPRPWRQMDDV